jgi:hypothetical protein
MAHESTGAAVALRRRRLAALAVVLGLAACSTARPVLYPNVHLQSVGREAADRDIEECERMANEAGADRRSGEAGQVAKGTAVGGGIGAASGAIGGAIAGGAGIGAAVGAASGAVAGLLGSLYSSRSSVTPAYTAFVDRCLREKGYEPTGWN